MVPTGNVVFRKAGSDQLPSLIDASLFDRAASTLFVRAVPNCDTGATPEGLSRKWWDALFPDISFPSVVSGRPEVTSSSYQEVLQWSIVNGQHPPLLPAKSPPPAGSLLPDPSERHAASLAPLPPPLPGLAVGVRELREAQDSGFSVLTYDPTTEVAGNQQPTAYCNSSVTKNVEVSSSSCEAAAKRPCVFIVLSAERNALLPVFCTNEVRVLFC